MGVVYKAEDLKLKRLVALKFLPPDLTSDLRSKERFAHEAQAASALEHPGICTVHDIGETGEGQTFIVMAYYDGETLKRKLTNGRLKVEQALEIAAQIADGLAKAHENGIVHRDIKPANIMISRDGSVKILDFGLAKLAGETKLTRTGTTVGTLMYMAPEQVQGQEVDARADIWALGVLLQEMITGVAPFRGEHEGALLYEIISAEPPQMADVVPDLEPELQQLVSKCLEKNPEERYQSAKDVSVDCRRIKREMKAIRQLTGTYPHSGRIENVSPGKGYRFLKERRGRYNRIWMLLTAFFFVTTVVLLAIREAPVERDEKSIAIPVEIHPPENGKFHFVGARPGPIALSPDGGHIAFLASTKEREKKCLWIKALDEEKSWPLDNTEDATYPFWSYDGKQIAFFAGAKLKRIDIVSRVVTEVCDAEFGLGGSWNQMGTIIFAPSSSDPIMRVSENGGNPEPLLSLDDSKYEIYHQFPLFLPDGNHFLFLARTTFTKVKPGPDTVYVSSLDRRERKALIASTTNVAYSNGCLLYLTHNGTLVAAKFNLETLSIEGEPVPIATPQLNLMTGGAVFTVSRSSLLAYQESPAVSGSRLIVYDRSGYELSVPGDQADYWDVRFSPDAKKIAYSIAGEKSLDIWIRDLASGEKRSVAFGASPERLVVWSPNGKEVLYMALKTESHEIYRKSVVEGTTEVLVPTTHDYMKQPFDWSRDGKFVAFVTAARIVDPRNQCDIWILPMTGDKKPVPLVNGAPNEWDPRFSPDSKWIAYCSGESGQEEIYVSRFPGPWNPEPISHEGGRGRYGGRAPRWAKGGSEIFYLSSDNKLMVAQMKLVGATPQVVARKTLFQTRARSISGAYDVSADGAKIIINTRDEEQIDTPVKLIVNWTERLRKK
jgi:serine/threonine protein kinase